MPENHKKHNSIEWKIKGTPMIYRSRTLTSARMRGSLSSMRPAVSISTTSKPFSWPARVQLKTYQVMLTGKATHRDASHTHGAYLRYWKKKEVKRRKSGEENKWKQERERYISEANEKRNGGSGNEREGNEGALILLLFRRTSAHHGRVCHMLVFVDICIHQHSNSTSAPFPHDPAAERRKYTKCERTIKAVWLCNCACSVRQNRITHSY